MYQDVMLGWLASIFAAVCFSSANGLARRGKFFAKFQSLLLEVKLVKELHVTADSDHA